MDGSTMIEATTIPLGIHFGLSEADYLSDPGLGSTQLKQILISPLHYWWHSPHGPEYVSQTESSAMALGTALHKYILEGGDAFDEAYIIAPEKADHKDLLTTADDLREWLRERELKVGGKKDDLIDRVLNEDPCAAIWDVIVEAHATECEDTGVLSIGRSAAHDVRIRGEIIHKTPGIRDLLSGGYPEVSIFWEENGVRFKARIDYLTSTFQTDLKSFTNPNGDSIRKMIGRKVAGHVWHLQARLHWNGVQAAKEMLLKGGADFVFGDAPDSEWLVNFAKSPPGDFWWLFVQSSGAPIVKAWSCPRSRPKDHSDVWQDAQWRIEAATRAYAECVGRFGPDSAWIDTEPPVQAHDEDFPPWTIGD